MTFIPSLRLHAGRFMPSKTHNYFQLVDGFIEGTDNTALSGCFLFAVWTVRFDSYTRNMFLNMRMEQYQNSSDRQGSNHGEIDVDCLLNYLLAKSFPPIHPQIDLRTQATHETFHAKMRKKDLIMRSIEQLVLYKNNIPYGSYVLLLHTTEYLMESRYHCM